MASGQRAISEPALRPAAAAQPVVPDISKQSEQQSARENRHEGKRQGQSRISPAQMKRRQIVLPPFAADLSGSAYFRLVIAVRSAESFAMPAAPHQLEPKPPGLIAVMLVTLRLVVL